MGWIAQDEDFWAKFTFCVREIIRWVNKDTSFACFQPHHQLSSLCTTNQVKKKSEKSNKWQYSNLIVTWFFRVKMPIIGDLITILTTIVHFEISINYTRFQILNRLSSLQIEIENNQHFYAEISDSNQIQILSFQLILVYFPRFFFFSWVILLIW